jgi:eukaryotic-like serine/threonine-protein kinase
MAADHASPTNREARLDEVIAAYLEALENGQAPDRAELLAQHPDLAEDLNEFFQGEAQFDSLMTPLRIHRPATAGNGAAIPSTAPHSPAADASVGRLRTFGDYELLEEIARGGMGVVFKARQVSLNRVVALKMILAGQFASAAEVQRFRLEAEAAAQLDHPHIVPIYEIGEHDGQQYFTMKLIEGGSLAQALSGPRSAASQKDAARLLATVARAVHHAHQRGILHRDLKPANILLSRRTSILACPPSPPDQHRAGPGDQADKQGCLSYEPCVTDFGLAKRVREEEPSSRLTQSGIAVGTPAYMAPEQASGHGQALTVAADVYSLGAILYEVLTGQPPFRGPTPLDTLRDVLERSPRPPRGLNPRIGRDLETICLKCLQKDPQRRYASAAALADDLDRYLRGEPIQARPASGVGRAWRWARRNPALAVVGSLATGALVAVTVVSSLLAAHEARHAAELERAGAALAERDEQRQLALKEAERQAEEARRQTAVAEESFHQAHRAVSDFCLRVSDELAQVPSMQQFRKDLLTRGLDYYRTFLQQRGDDPALRGELADTYFNAGHITSTVGSKTKALELYQQALPLYQELAAARPDDTALQAKVAHTLNNIGVMQADLGRHAAAVDSARQALDICERLAHLTPARAERLDDLAFTYHQLGALAADAGQMDEALGSYGRARDLWEQLYCVSPRSTHYAGSLALCVNNMGVVQGKLSRDREALRSFETARAIREKLVAEKHTSNAQVALAASYRDIALTHQRLGHPDEALVFSERARDIREKMAHDNPSVTLFQSDWAASLVDLGHVHFNNGRLSSALECYNQALGIQKKLAAIDAGAAGPQRALARTHYYCGRVLAANRQWEDALRAFQGARSKQEKLVAADPDSHDLHSELGATLAELSRVLGHLNRADEALAERRAAVAQDKTAFEQAPQVPGYRRALAEQYRALAEAAHETGEALDALQEARKLWPGNAQELFRLACDLAAAGDRVGKDKTELSEREQAERQRCDDLALDTLREAAAAGFSDAGRLQKEPRLARLRQRPAFQDVLAGLRN